MVDLNWKKEGQWIKFNQARIKGYVVLSEFDYEKSRLKLWDELLKTTKKFMKLSFWVVLHVHEVAHLSLAKEQKPFNHVQETTTATTTEGSETRRRKQWKGANSNNNDQTKRQEGWNPITSSWLRTSWKPQEKNQHANVLMHEKLETTRKLKANDKHIN